MILTAGRGSARLGAAGCGAAWLGKETPTKVDLGGAWLCSAWRRTVRQVWDGQALVASGGDVLRGVASGPHGLHGAAGRGMALHGQAGLGQAGSGWAGALVESGLRDFGRGSRSPWVTNMAGSGRAWLGEARSGAAWHGGSWLGQSRQGYLLVKSGAGVFGRSSRSPRGRSARQGTAVQGRARQVTARQVKGSVMSGSSIERCCSRSSWTARLGVSPLGMDGPGESRLVRAGHGKARAS
jgi:hypothetical protein